MARPEPTQLERLSNASFLGKLLVLAATVRLDWKVIARYKHSSLFVLVVNNKGKKFYNIDTWTTVMLGESVRSLKVMFRGRLRERILLRCGRAKTQAIATYVHIFIIKTF